MAQPPRILQASGNDVQENNVSYDKEMKIVLRYIAHREESGSDFKSQEGFPGEVEFLTSTNLPTYSYVLTKFPFLSTMQYLRYL